jgi:hypothetical protein
VGLVAVVGIEEVRNLSPMPADRIGVPTNKGLEYVVEQLETAMK